MATALANEQMAPASTTSRQSCSVTRQFRTWYITDPSVACNYGSIGIFWGNRRGSVARMVNKTLLEALAETALSRAIRKCREQVRHRSRPGARNRQNRFGSADSGRRDVWR